MITEQKDLERVIQGWAFDSYRDLTPREVKELATRIRTGSGNIGVRRA